MLDDLLHLPQASLPGSEPPASRREICRSPDGRHASQIIAIETGGFDQGTAKLLMSMEISHISSLICSVSELLALEVENIINAAL
jgi:hypothetical protein